jgi:hypothetical protein
MKIARTIGIWLAGLLGCLTIGNLIDPLFPHPLGTIGSTTVGLPILFVCFRLWMSRLPSASLRGSRRNLIPTKQHSMRPPSYPSHAFLRRERGQRWLSCRTW